MDFTSVCYSGDSVMYVGTSSGKLFFFNVVIMVLFLLLLAVVLCFCS